MGAFICKQPNGKYCRFSTVVDTITHYNMTKEDYINMRVEKAIEEAKKDAIDTLLKWLYPFEEALDRFQPNNETKEEFAQKLQKIGASEEQINQILNMEDGENDE